MEKLFSFPLDQQQQIAKVTLNHITLHIRLRTCMSSDSFVMVCNFFGLKSVEDLICAQQNRFVIRYISTANSLCGLISRKYCWPCLCSCDSCLSVKSASCVL